MLRRQLNTQPEGFPGQRLVIIPPCIVASVEHQPIIRDLYITHIGAFSNTKNHYVERKNGSQEHLMIACLSGKGQCRFADQDWQLNTGDLLFLPPYQFHSYGSNLSYPWTIFWIHFRGHRVDDYLSSLGVDASRPVFPTQDIKSLVEGFEDIFRHVNHGFSDASMLAMSTSFSRLLGIAKVNQRNLAKRSIQSESRLIQVLSNMREHSDQSWTLDQMAQLAAMSVPHFIELCRQQTGLPPNAYLIRIRLQRALDLLIDGKHNVSETARIVGYDDPFYFSRLFRKHMGMSPSAILRDNSPMQHPSSLTEFDLQRR